MVQRYPSLSDVDRISSYRWECICEANQACRELVLSVIADMYNTDSATGHLPESTDPRLLDLAASRRIIVANGGEVSFVDSDMRLGLLAHYVAEKLLIPAWDDPPRFAEEVRSVARREHGFVGNAGLARIAMVVLHNEYRRDIVERAAAEADTKSHGFWDLYSPFTQAVPYLHATVDVLAPALASIQKAIEGDLANGLMHHAVEALSERQPEIGKALLRELVGAGAGPAAVFIPQVLKGLSRRDFHRTYDQALELSHSEDPVLASYGVAALSQLQYCGAAREQLLHEVLDRYASLRVTGPAPTVAAVAYAYGNLLSYGQDVQDALVELSARSETEIQYEVSRVLLSCAKEQSDEQWLRRALLNLAAVKTVDRHTLDHLDAALSSVARSDTRLPGSFLEKWIVSRDCDEVEGEEFVELFGSTLSTLRTCQPGALEEYITTWFSADDTRLHRAARDIVEMLCARRGEPPDKGIVLSRSVLNSVAPEDVCFTIRKILGWVVDSEALTTLVFSAMQRRPTDRAVSDLVVWAFVEYVAYNYPRPAIGLLKERIKEGDEVEACVARIALERVEAYYSPLRDLPKIRELEPPAHRVRQLQRARQRAWRGIVNAAQRQSVIWRLVTRIPLKEGTFFFRQSDGAHVPEKTRLSEFQFTQDLPRGDLIDPIGQAYSRLVWRSEVREARCETGH